MMEKLHQNEQLSAEQKKEIITHAAFVKQLEYRMTEVAVPEKYKVAVNSILSDRFVRKYSAADFSQVFPDKSATVDDFASAMSEEEVWDALREASEDGVPEVDPAIVTQFLDVLEDKIKENALKVYE
jgi:hypothetical protein